MLPPKKKAQTITGREDLHKVLFLPHLSRRQGVPAHGANDKSDDEENSDTEPDDEWEDLSRLNHKVLQQSLDGKVS
jgi:hypothetical protein